MRSDQVVFNEQIASQEYTENDPAPLVLLSDDTLVEGDCACSDHTTGIQFEGFASNWSEDCACENQMASTDANRIYDRLSYIRTDNALIESLPNGHRLIFSPFAPTGPVVVNQSAFNRLNSFSCEQPLQSTTLDQTLATHRLIQPVGFKGIWQHTEPATLTAWLHVTNACNLDCPYCYVRKSSARMSEETGFKAVDLLFSSAQENGFKSVKLKYAGGEATLHFKLIQSLHNRAVELSRQTGIDLREVILSNGVHIREKDARWLRDAGIKLAISVDGIGNDHDQQRPLRNGGGSFSQIEHTIDNVLLPLGIHPDITITVTQLNTDGVADAVRWAIERDLPISLNFYRANSLSRSRTNLQLEESAIIRGMEAAYEVFEEILPIRPFLNGLLDRVQAYAHTHTCGVGLAYMVITHEGKLAQCQMHLEQPVAENLDEALLPLIASGAIRNLSVDEKEGCRECIYRYRCTGGCPLETFRATGRWDVQSPHCHIYKTLFPKALRLEGLRLLKVNGYL